MVASGFFSIMVNLFYVAVIDLKQQLKMGFILNLLFLITSGQTFWLVSCTDDFSRLQYFVMFVGFVVFFSSFLHILIFFMFCGFCHDLRQYFGIVVGFVGRAVPLLGGAVARFMAGLRQHKPLIFT